MAGAVSLKLVAEVGESLRAYVDVCRGQRDGIAAMVKEVSLEAGCSPVVARMLAAHMKAADLLVARAEECVDTWERVDSCGSYRAFVEKYGGAGVEEFVVLGEALAAGLREDELWPL